MYVPMRACGALQSEFTRHLVLQGQRVATSSLVHVHVCVSGAR